MNQEQFVLSEEKYFDPDPFQKYCLRVFSYLKPGATFLSIENYKNNFNEIADFNVCFKFDYLNSVGKSFDIINNYKPTTAEYIIYPQIRAAQNELLNSFKMTLNGYNPHYTCYNVYASIFDAYGNKLSGVKYHLTNNELYIDALRMHKNIKKYGSYPNRISDPLTISKRYLRNMTPLKNFVQFKLTPNKFERLTINKTIIEGIK